MLEHQPSTITDFGSVQISGAGDTFVAVDLPAEQAPTLAEYHRIADEVMLGLSTELIPGLPTPPAKRQRRIARFAYLPCAHITELSPRAKVAGILARRGWQCVVGDAAPMSLNGYGDMPPGVVMFSAAGVAEARAIYKAQSHGHQVLLHERAHELLGNKWARDLADYRCEPTLGYRARETLIVRNLAEFKRRVTKWFTHRVGEVPDAKMRGLFHAFVDQDHDGYVDTEPCGPGAPDHIANLFHRLWVTTQIDMPWFDVMTAWLARKQVELQATSWSEVLPDEVVAREIGDAGVYSLAPNVWAVRARAAQDVAA